MALWKAKLTIAAMAAVALFSASAAKAQVTCESLPNPIYMQGSSATQAVWNLVGPLLADAGTNLVYQGKGSCIGVQDIENIQNGTAATLVNGPSTYWSPDGGVETCTSTNDNVDIGLSDVFQSTCDIVLGATGPTVGTFSGPTQVMTYIRPIDTNNAMMPNEISAEQAYFVFGTSAGDAIDPWSQPDEDSMTLPSFLYIRGPTSGTQSMIAQAILLNPSLSTFLGYVESGTGALITAVAAQMGVAGDQSVLGIAVAGGGYDSKRSEVQALAFRGYQQSAAWLPDSSVSTFDKRNVRAGLYTVFGPFQVLYNVDGNGAATDPAATTLLDYLNGTTPVPGTTSPVTKYEIGASMIPDCAMGVTRFDTANLGGNTEGAIVPNTNREHSCDCYFESQVNMSTVTCTACPNGASDCPDGYCGPNGVCEAF
jgi:hypothetical protein